MDKQVLVILIGALLHVVLGKHPRRDHYNHARYLDVTSRDARDYAPYLDTNEIGGESCVRSMERVYTDHVLVPSPPHLKGEWVSHRCEVRPGPEFVLRRYKFIDETNFELHQYYYRDSDCTDPAYSIVAKGQLYLGEPSWLVSGGLDAEYELSLVSIMPYTDYVARKLQENFKRSCPQMVRDRWKALKSYVLYQFLLDTTGSEDEDEADILIDHDCKASLNLVFHELQLIRMEVRKRDLELKRELFLGDIHTDYTQREYYRPTSYQDSLYFSQTSGCIVCARILSSDRTRPPRLTYRPKPQDGIHGEWFSTQCEVRPVGQFITRHFMFNPDGKTWQGYFHYFSDARCQKPLYTVHASGNQYIGQKADVIDGAYEFDVHVKRMSVTPRDQRIVNLMNDDQGEGNCGPSGSWIPGIEQEITETSGCFMLGLKVPVIAHELVRLQRDNHHTLLFLGQGQTVSETTDTDMPHMRSTSFQAPLVRCGSVKSTRKAFNTFLPQGEGQISVDIQAQVAPAADSGATSLVVNSLLFTLLHLILVIRLEL